MKSRYKIRQKKILDKYFSGIDGFLITNIKNIRYLTGFTGSFALLLLTKEKDILIVDFRYFEQAKKETNSQIILLDFSQKWFDAIKKICSENAIKKLGFEVTCTYDMYNLLKKNLENIELVPVEYAVEEVRAIKDSDEILCIKKAVKIAEKAFLRVKPYIKEGKTEREIALRLEHSIRKLGTQILPFPVIVASGENSAMPHWRNSERKLKKGDFVIIDWGAEYNGYFSDMTRTFVIGQPNKKQIEIYNIVNEARKKAIEACKTDIKAKKIDEVARDFIKDAGYGEIFGHSTGHGVGLDVHELPKISTTSENLLECGMIFTIEPGIYIEGFGGVRIEDMVLVRKNSIEVLTNISRELEIL
ncbi:M24 family metallopeptidase [Thermodesulfovibrio hydrogeniphilus]